MRLGIFIIYLFCSPLLFANDSLLIPKLFQNLLYKQHLESDFFKEGSFESYRQHNNSLDFKPDNNIFFTALVSYTLQNLKPYLTSDEKIVTDTIVNRTKKSFTFYKHNSERLSYNFWPSQPKKVFFPNDAILSSLSESLALPDDLDDTGLILSTLNLPDSIAKKAHDSMQEFVNGNKKRINNTLSDYKNIPAYSTWYGKKMPIDFDFGVHCNILSFVNHYNLSWTKADSATYNLILQIIDDGNLVSQPKFISPYYATTPILIYHLAKLMTTKNLNELELRKPLLIKTALELLQKTDILLDKVILETSLMKFGYYDSLLELDLSNIDKTLYLNEFTYYHGHLFAHLNSTIKKIANQLSFTEFKWYCSAFNDCLLLEYLILKYRKQHKSD